MMGGFSHPVENPVENFSRSPDRLIHSPVENFPPVEKVAEQPRRKVESTFSDGAPTLFARNFEGKG